MWQLALLFPQDPFLTTVGVAVFAGFPLCGELEPTRFSLK
jgi:hypothetical protein